MNKRILIVPGMLLALTTAAYAQSSTSGAGEPPTSGNPAMSNQQSDQNNGMSADKDQAQQSQQAPSRMARNHAKKSAKGSSNMGTNGNTMGSSNGTMDSGANSSSSPPSPNP